MSKTFLTVILTLFLFTGHDSQRHRVENVPESGEKHATTDRNTAKRQRELQRERRQRWNFVRRSSYQPSDGTARNDQRGLDESEEAKLNELKQSNFGDFLGRNLRRKRRETSEKLFLFRASQQFQ